MSSVVLTDLKVVLLGLLSDQSGGFWNEQPPANLPSNIRLVSSTFDSKAVTTPQVVVGDQTMEPGEWLSAKDYIMRPKADVHVFIYRDLSAGALSAQDYGTMKKQEYAMIENIRGILTRHSDRPRSDCMFVFYDPMIVDRDVRNQQEVMLHKIIRCSGWFVQSYS